MVTLILSYKDKEFLIKEFKDLYNLNKTIDFLEWRFQHANAPPAKLKNIFVKTLKRGTKI